MAKQRMVNTRIWSDGWIRKLKPLERYLFLYLLTNEHTNICGIYELTIETMAYETGLDISLLSDEILPNLSPKVLYIDEYVVLTNFIKHQNQKSPKVRAGISAEISQIPEKIVAESIRYGYGMDTLSHSNSNSNLNSNPNLNIYGDKSPRLEITFRSMPISLEELNDGDVTYEEEFAKAPKKYKGLTKAYARIAIKYLQMRGEGGNVLRYYPDIKELWGFAAKDVSPEKIEEEVVARIEAFKKQQEAKGLDWALGGVVKNWNKILKEYKN